MTTSPEELRHPMLTLLGMGRDAFDITQMNSTAVSLENVHIKKVLWPDVVTQYSQKKITENKTQAKKPKLTNQCPSKAKFNSNILHSDCLLKTCQVHVI